MRGRRIKSNRQFFLLCPPILNLVSEVFGELAQKGIA